MTDHSDNPGAAPDPTLFPKTVGERLREARLAQKLELADVASRTRIPLRHLQAIEDGDYSQMPTPTYAIGFAKAYARAVGEDEVVIAQEVRGQSEFSTRRVTEYQPYETDDPARTAPGGVMIAGIVIAVLLLIGVGLWFGTTLFRGDGLTADTPAATASFAPEAAPPPAPVAPAAGQVTLVANDEVWLRIYDAGGQTLFEKTLAAGERYDVPADANSPMINVGRPDKLQVLLNGSAVAPLGDGKVAIKDVGIGAAALAARAAAAPVVSPSAAPLPGPAASPSPTPSASRSVPAAFRSPAPKRTATPAPAAPREAIPVPTNSPSATPTAGPLGNAGA